MSNTETTVEIPQHIGQYAHCFAYGYLMSAVNSLAMTAKRREHDPALLMEEINNLIKMATAIDGALQRHQANRVREIREEAAAIMSS